MITISPLVVGVSFEQDLIAKGVIISVGKKMALLVLLRAQSRQTRQLMLLKCRKITIE